MSEGVPIYLCEGIYQDASREVRQAAVFVGGCANKCPAENRKCPWQLVVLAECLHFDACSCLCDVWCYHCHECWLVKRREMKFQPNLAELGGQIRRNWSYVCGMRGKKMEGKHQGLWMSF